MTVPEGPAREHLLVGMEATNPLAALAAFGTLRTLAGPWPPDDVKMSWQTIDSQWRPVLHFPSEIAPEEVVSRLHDRLSVPAESPEFSMSDESGEPRNNLNDISPDQFERIAEDALRQGNIRERRLADYCAGYGTNGVEEEAEEIDDTALRTMSGAGHQHFLGFMRKLVVGTTAEHLWKTLYRRWDYSDEKPTLRWDPRDDRRHAYMAQDPSDQSRGNEIRTMRGANRLAIEALPLFPTMPAADGARTRAFFRSGSDVALTLPVWEEPIGISTLSSLLGHPEIVKERPERRWLRLMGVVELYRARRVTEGYYRNFTLGRPVAGA